MQEIERKFLIKGDEWLDIRHGVKIVQGYISLDPTVRIRLQGDKGFLTIKGASNESGLSRFEWEKEIDFFEAQDLLRLCSNIVNKTRYTLWGYGNSHPFELDVFEGDNEGLVVVELELNNEYEEYFAPSWLGEEVTGDKKYYNSYLGEFPYTTWNKNTNGI